MKRPVLLLMTVLLLTACGGQSPAAETQVSASFARGGEGPAFTYDPRLVPVGATVAVTDAEQDGATVATLRVTGLLPNRPMARTRTRSPAPRPPVPTRARTTSSPRTR